MEDRNRALREALSRLLAATTPSAGREGCDGPELLAAREQAARALLCERAFTGRQWARPDAEDGFLEQWIRLKSDEGALPAVRVKVEPARPRLAAATLPPRASA